MSNASKLAALVPDFATRVEKFLSMLEGITGRIWGISDGRRTIARQNELYAQGRTAPGKIVTNAKGGSSPHNFGLAVDLWPMTPAGDFDWNAPDDLFHVMAQLAQDSGFVAGYFFKSIHDAPHIEDANWRTQQALWREGKVQVA